MLQRRTFLKKLSDSSLYILTIGAFLNHPLKGWAKWNQEAFQAKEFQKSVKAIYDSTPIESTDQIKIEAPDVAENGLSVPVSVSSSIKQIENLSIFIENNPLPLIANYHLKEGMIPEFSMRGKVAKSSNIHVMVQTADKLYSSTRKIQVTLGGCAED